MLIDARRCGRTGVVAPTPGKDSNEEDDPDDGACTPITRPDATDFVDAADGNCAVFAANRAAAADSLEVESEAGRGVRSKDTLGCACSGEAGLASAATAAGCGGFTAGVGGAGKFGVGEADRGVGAPMTLCRLSGGRGVSPAAAAAALIFGCNEGIEAIEAPPLPGVGGTGAVAAVVKGVEAD